MYHKIVASVKNLMSFKATSGNDFSPGREVAGRQATIQMPTFLASHTGRIACVLNTVPGYRIAFLSM